MNRNNCFVIATVIGCILVSACNHYYYVPQAQNVPLFREKQEVSLHLASSIGTDVSTTDVQTAYALGNHVAILANAMYASGGNKESGNWGKGKIFGGGLGYFTPIQSHGIFELLGGFWLGQQQHNFQKTTIPWGGIAQTVSGRANLACTKYFLQPAIGLRFPAIDIAISTNITYLSFTQISNDIDVTLPDYLDVTAIAAHRNVILLEPALTIRLGWKFVKFQLQYSSSRNLSLPQLRFIQEKMSVGLSFSYSRRFHKPKVPSNK